MIDEYSIEKLFKLGFITMNELINMEILRKEDFDE